MAQRVVRNLILGLALALSSLFLSARAAPPADANIKAALYDIERYEKQFLGKSSERAPTVKRTLKLLTIARQKLDGSPNRSDASWIEADARHTNLVAHLQSLLTPAKGNPAASTPTTATSKPLSSAASASSASSGQPHMISQQRARIKKLVRDIQSVKQTVDQNGVKPFQAAAYVEKVSKRTDTLESNLGKFDAFPNDDDVQRATEALQALRKMIAFAKSEATKTMAALGDVQATLRNIYTARQGIKPPDAPNAPYADKAIEQWVQRSAAIRQQRIAEAKTLKHLQTHAYLPDDRRTVEAGGRFDQQNLTSMLHGSQDDVRRIDKTLQLLTANLDAQARHATDSLAWFDNLDPADTHHQANAFLGEGQVANAHERLDQQLNIAQAAATFDRLLKRPTLGAREDLVKRIKDTRRTYDDKRTAALSLVRMPKSASTEQRLIDIARETLSKPDYEVGSIERLVISSDRVKREKETSEVEFDKVDVRLNGDIKLSGTQTTTRFEWEQYQVATAEPVGDKYFIFYNTLKYFTKGGTTTPLNRWLLSGRIKSVEIPRDSISK
ncbi:MAG: hypothetical protein AAF493_15775 [Pseudomonadota bacterium]